MGKIVFTQQAQIDLTKRLQLMLLEAVMSCGNWNKDQIRFQGGTCLSLVYGSPRFSEDLDFIIGTDKGLNRMLTAASARMNAALMTALPGAQVRFSGRDDDMESQDAKNPRTFTVTVNHPDWYRAVKIKAEFWRCDPEAVSQYAAGVRSANVLSAVVNGNPLRMTLAPVLVPAAQMQEIVVDKLHALVGRPYLKHRDVFDLWWLQQQGVGNWNWLVQERYDNHARMYPGSAPDLDGLMKGLKAAAVRVADLAKDQTFAADLRKWLGEESPLATRDSADNMATQVAQGINTCVAAYRLAREDELDAKAPVMRKKQP